MPQKTLGSLPCPIVYSVQIAWLPCGSTFDRAHGRGVAQLSHSAAGPLLGVETGTNQIGWMSTNFSPSLRPQPNGWPGSCTCPLRINTTDIPDDRHSGKKA